MNQVRVQGGMSRWLGLVNPYFWVCLWGFFWKRLTLWRSKESTDGREDWLLAVWGEHLSIFCPKQKMHLLLRASASAWNWSHQLPELASFRGKYSSACWNSVSHSWLLNFHHQGMSQFLFAVPNWIYLHKYFIFSFICDLFPI